MPLSTFSDAFSCNPLSRAGALLQPDLAPVGAGLPAIELQPAGGLIRQQADDGVDDADAERDEGNHAQGNATIGATAKAWHEIGQ